MTIDKKINYKNKPVMQGGVQNYLGKQPQVMAPRKWQSSPDKPATELAYITKKEKDLILKANIHGGLEKGPNMGPSGIMSLDSFGDADAGVSGGLSGGDVSDAETGRSFAGANTISDTYGRDLRAGAIAAGGRQRLNEPQSVLNQVRALQKQFGPRIGTNTFSNLFSPSNIISGLGSLISGPLGLATKAFGFLGKNVQDLRGYNPDGTPRTQEQYEKDRKERQLAGRLDNLYDRKLSGKNFSQKNIDMLESMGVTTSKGNIKSAIDRDIINEPEMPQFARSYLSSISKTPEITGLNLNDFEGYDLGLREVPGYKGTMSNDGIIGLNIGLPSNNLMAGLTKMQKKGLDAKKNAVGMGLFSPQDALDSISPFNDPDDPATIEEVKEYYGIV